MMRALLALILAVFVSSTAVSAAERMALAQHVDQAAKVFNPAPAHQGQDTEDVEHQPCVSARSGGGKAALDLGAAAPQHRHSPSLAITTTPLRPPVLKPVVFLYSCAPRAPPPHTLSA